MLETLATLGTALKTAYEASKFALASHDAAVIRAKVGEMQGQISSALASAIAAQTDQMAALERIRDLEQKIADLENWEAEKKRYELKDLGSGALARVIKPAMQGSDPTHCICADCYERGQKRYLVSTSRIEYGRRVWICNECKATIRVLADPWPPEGQ